MAELFQMKEPDAPAGSPAGPDAWLARIAQGDEPALGALYDATRRRVFGLTLHVLRDRELAEEATLDTYMQVWRIAARFDAERGDAWTWLLTLARSRALDVGRRKLRRTERETELDPQTYSIPDSRPGPEHTGEQHERAERVRHALRSLPEPQRRAIEIAYYSGLSHSEVARALGEPLGTVKTRIRTGMSNLRRQLADLEGSSS